MGIREHLGQRVEVMGELAGLLYDAVADNVDTKLADQSAFVGHLVNFVFLQFLAQFVYRATGDSFDPYDVPLYILATGLFLFSLVFVWRIGIVIARFAESLVWPEGLKWPKASLIGYWRAVGVFVLIVVYLAVMNSLNYAVGAVLSELGKLGLPALEVSLPPGSDDPTISPDGIPKCYINLCL